MARCAHKLRLRALEHSSSWYLKHISCPSSGVLNLFRNHLRSAANDVEDDSCLTISPLFRESWEYWATWRSFEGQESPHVS